MHGGVADDSRSPVNLGFTSFELGLHERYYPGTRSQEWYKGRQDEA
jgi:hypothetical protein